MHIARLIVSEFVGLYVVKVKDGAPLHYHRFLDEYHFLPEYINGLHYLEGKISRTTQTDILYIKRGRFMDSKIKNCAKSHSYLYVALKRLVHGISFRI